MMTMMNQGKSRHTKKQSFLVNISQVLQLRKYHWLIVFLSMGLENQVGKFHGPLPHLHHGWKQTASAENW